MQFTSTSRHASIMRAYWSLLTINPLVSFLASTGAWPKSLIMATVRSMTDCLVQGAGMTSTRGI